MFDIDMGAHLNGFIASITAVHCSFPLGR